MLTYPAPPQADVTTPLRFGEIQLSDRDWQYRTERNPSMENRVIHWPRGKLLGGCSSINAMLWVRCHPGAPPSPPAAYLTCYSRGL